MSLASIETPGLFPIVHLSRVECLQVDSLVRGQYVYKSAWTPLTDKMCQSNLWEDNKHDKYVVNNQLYQHLKEDVHIKGVIKNKLIFLNVWQNFNIY